MCGRRGTWVSRPTDASCSTAAGRRPRPRRPREGIAMVRVPRLKSMASLAVGFAVVAAGLLGVPGVAGAARAPQQAPAEATAQWKGLPPFDSRTADGFVATPTGEQAVARADLARSLGTEGVV